MGKQWNTNVHLQKPKENKKKGNPTQGFPKKQKLEENQEKKQEHPSLQSP